MSAVDSTAEEVGTELEPVAAQPPSTLFGTTDPVEIIERASKVAAALKSVLAAQGMLQNIQGKQYVRVEGWQTLGSMLGVTPVVVWTRPIDGGWEARVEARTADGRTVGAAESMCTEAEGGNWGKRATSNARRSMAQTRAVSKALRGPLGFVVTLAGYQATPAEEMTHVAAPTPPPEPKPTGPPVSEQEAEVLLELLRTLGLPGRTLKTLFASVGVASDNIGPELIRSLTVDQATELHGKLAEYLPKDGDMTAALGGAE